MSLTASYVALVVIIIRMLLGKSPKIFSYVIWAVVWFRLVCPVSFESPLSLVPIKSPIPYDITTSTNPMVRFGLRSVDNVLNQSIKSSVPTVNPAASVNPMGVVMEIAAVIWLLGIAVILCYSIVSYSRLKIVFLLQPFSKIIYSKLIGLRLRLFLGSSGQNLYTNRTCPKELY